MNMIPTPLLRACLPAILAFLLPSGAYSEGVPPEYGYIQDAFPDLVVTAVKPSPVEGFLEVAVGAEFLYVTDDAKYVFRGDLFELASFENLTETSRSDARSSYLTSIDDDTTIIFPAKNPKYTVTIFTDIDCGYCRKLHRQIAEYNDLGITVRYLFFPRSGPGTPSWAKAEAVWCAESRQEALTKAKNNLPLNSEDCGTTPVAAHYEIVNSLSLRGTPAIFTEQGQHIMGYRSPEELLVILDAEQS
jgi:thiol:disulfide interchange protein DsbC